MWPQPVTFPAWATIDTSAMKTALTITNKFQVTVTATAPGDITYGAALGDPSASQTAGAHGTDASGTYTYCYEGSGSTDYGPSAEKPVNAGTYTVTATLVSDTHAGISAPAAFAIGKKALTEGMLTITGTYVYTGSSITPSYTVADGRAAPGERLHRRGDQQRERRQERRGERAHRDHHRR